MPAGKTYEPIATQTLGSAAATVTFSSISGAYTDLVLVVANIKNASSSATPFVYFNGDTATNYSGTILEGNGTTAQSGSRTNNANGVPAGGTFVGGSTTVPYQFIMNIMNYSNTTTYKTTISRYGLSSAEVEVDVGLWRNTAAITSLTIKNDAGSNFTVGSTFSLYGIKAA
jgi:hypothetical protein